MNKYTQGRRTGMYRYRILFRILAVPLMIVLTVVQGLLLFVTGFSAIFFYLLAGAFLIIDGVFLLAGAIGGMEAIQILLAGFVFFLVPLIGGGIVGLVTALNARVIFFVRHG